MKIGITGGIGSGKTMVCSILENMGYPVYYSDIEAKKIVDSDPEIKRKLIDLLGSKVYSSTGLNRKFLADKIFKNEDLREKVNAIIHPQVRSYFNIWADHQTTSLVFNEAAILFETGAYKNFDRMILITAPEEVRMQRVMKRDQVSKDEVVQRMNNQWKDEQKVLLADFIIVNDGTKPLLDQVVSIIQALEN